MKAKKERALDSAAPTSPLAAATHQFEGDLARSLFGIVSLPSFAQRLSGSEVTVLCRTALKGFRFAGIATQAKPLEQLSTREKQIATMVGHGLGNRGIGHALAISEQTVAHHLTSIYEKTGLGGRAQLARWALVTLPEDPREVC